MKSEQDWDELKKRANKVLGDWLLFKASHGIKLVTENEEELKRIIADTPQAGTIHDFMMTSSPIIVKDRIDGVIKYCKENPATKNHAYQLILDEIVELAERKNHDYSPLNISVCGLKGVAVRLVDKAMRLNTLTEKGAEAKVKDETLEDTLVDISNYGLIGLMLKRGWWDLPWKSDLPKQEK